jgi:hypothetical protein
MEEGNYGFGHDDTFLRHQFHSHERIDNSGRLHGMYYARVTNITDPDGMGRLKARMHWLEEEGGPQLESDWMTRCVPFSGPTNLARGRTFGVDWPMPEVGSDVLIMFEAGDPHNPIFVGMPSYLSGQYGAPPLSKDSNTAWSFRICFQNGTELGVDTEGNVYLTVAGNLRVKILGSGFISARGCLTMMGIMVRVLSQTVLRLLGMPIDQTNYVRPDERAQVREMQIDAYTSPAGRRDSGIGNVPDEEV